MQLAFVIFCFSTFNAFLNLFLVEFELATVFCHRTIEYSFANWVNILVGCKLQAQESI